MAQAAEKLFPRDGTAPPPGLGRNSLIDAVRAVPLAGVIIMNMMTFSGLSYLTPEMRAEVLGTLDLIAWAFLRSTVDGKALAAFSFMFGVSFSMILARMGHEGGLPLRRLVQRLLSLFLIGLFNAVFLYWADILMTYAALGMILPFAARLPSWLLAGLAVLLILAGPLTLAVSGMDTAAPPARGHVDSIDGFASPSLLDVIRQNLQMLTSASDSADSTLLLRLFILSGLFLLGLAAGKSGLINGLAARRGLLLRLGAALTLAGLAMKLTLRLMDDPVGPWAMLNLQSPVMALGYLMLIAFLLSARGADGARRLLAPLGRMTLTGYLMSALLGQLVFYGWGFGLIGAVGTLAAIAVALAIYAALLVFAHLWFRRFRVGPWEWLWRSLARLEPRPIAADRTPPR